jgi:hypothetical protein
MAALEPSAWARVNPLGQPGNLQTPPTTSSSDVESWVAEGSYKAWKCETVVHPQMGVSPHGCHAAAGSDATHSVLGSSDFIYLQAGK